MARNEVLPNEMTTHLSTNISPQKGTLDDLERLFLEDGQVAIRSRESEKGKDVLWEGFFGMFDGPDIVPTKSTTQRLHLPGLSARHYERSRWFGLSDRVRRLNVTSTFAGANLTALCAYIAKSSEENAPAPYINIEQTAVDAERAGSIDRINSSTLRVRDPYGVEGAALDMYETQQDAGTGSEQLRIMYSGTVAIRGLQGILRLPEVVNSQARVFESQVNEDPIVVMRAYGASSQEQLDKVWHDANRQEAPIAAARLVLDQLV